VKARTLVIAAASAAVLAASAPVPARGIVARPVGSPGAFPAGPVTSLLVRGGVLYAGTSGSGVVSFDLNAGNARAFTRKDGLPSDGVRSLALFQGKVFAGTAAGLAVEDGNGWKEAGRDAPVSLGNATLAVAPDGKEFWVGAMNLTGGVVRFDGARWVFVGGQGKGLFNDVGSFAFSPEGVLMGSTSGAVYRVRGSEIVPLGDGFPAANVTALGERGGTIYAGTNRGLYLLRGAKWSPARVPAGFDGAPVYCILRSDLDLLVGGRTGLLLLDAKGETKVLSGRNGLPDGAVTALAAAGGTLYAATAGGVFAVTDWRE